MRYNKNNISRQPFAMLIIVQSKEQRCYRFRYSFTEEKNGRPNSY